MLNKATIHSALSIIHTLERTSRNPQGMTRVEAVEHVLRHGPTLTHTELDILLRAIHVDRTELHLQWSVTL